MRKRITLHDLAAQLGLTIQTVSKALRGLPGMSEQTRSEVFKLARELGYMTKDQKQTLQLDHISPYPVVQRRFVLVQNKMSLNFNRLLLQGLHERFMEFGHTVQPLLIPPDLKPSQFQSWAEDQELLYAEGIFIAPRMNHDLLEQKLLELPLPRILLNFPPPESKVDSVIWDVYEAMFQAVRRLVRMGHRNILYVGDTQDQRGFVIRWQAFCEAMKEAGYAVNTREHVTKRDGTDKWLQDVEQLYQQRKPTAVICGIDEEAAPVYYTLRRMGAQIPQQCSFVALLNEQTDTLPLCSRPQLPIRESGYRAADRMLWRIANPHLPFEHVRLQGEFFMGSTLSVHKYNE
ncbi:LacI family DNA-binding transcriptional regulator [Paenibacillus anseongense]|uniref:LacI family DNA-binding transcriptional regulator n=1 Tax=Paenibacillus anseongense TaxID=2682845 RepID=UPI002DBF0449|nr:LacI family DNA-binding transcriptional regulator [Paenibacillus anseongense]MEC0264485.1 LacI family DNA-binding transcriptional regulator [Paenibacillus anseongense]